MHSCFANDFRCYYSCRILVRQNGEEGRWCCEWVRKKCRITSGRSSGEGDIAEMVVNEDAENEFLLFDSDCNDTESDSDGDTDDHVVIPLDFSPLYHPLSLSFTANVGSNVLGQSYERIMLFLTYFVLQNFINISLIRLTSTQVKS